MGQYSIPDSDVKRYTDYLDKIRCLFQDEDCLQYYVVKNDELLEIKKEIEKNQNINQMFIRDGNYTKILHKNFTRKEIVEHKGMPHRKIINIYPEHMNMKNTSSPKLHRDFEKFSAPNKYNMLYYHKIENCDPDISGTGIGFIDTNGNKQYFILPAFEGLMIIMRDKCMVHNTPNIEPIDPKKPITRILMRDYIGSPLEVSYFDEQKNKDEFEELIKNGIVKVNTIYTEFPGGNHSNIHFYHCY